MARVRIWRKGTDSDEDECQTSWAKVNDKRDSSDAERMEMKKQIMHTDNGRDGRERKEKEED